MLYTHICRFTSTYMHIYMLNNSQRHNDKNAHRKTSLEKYIPLNLFARFERVVSGSTVRRSWRPNIKFNILTPLLWPSTLCLSRSPALLIRRPWGPALCRMMAFFTAFYQQLLWAPTQSGAPSPFGWCGFPYHISSITPSDL